MLVEIVLKLFKFFICKDESIAGTVRNGVSICEMTNFVDCVANLFMFAMESEKGGADCFPILVIQRSA